MKRLLFAFVFLFLSMMNTASAADLSNLQVGLNRISNNLTVENFIGIVPTSSVKVPVGYPDLATKVIDSITMTAVGLTPPINTPPVTLVNTMPVMTGYTTNGVTITADSDYPGYLAWYAFDGKADSNNYGCLGSGSCWQIPSVPPAGGHWVKVDFGTGRAMKVTKINLMSGNVSYSITSFKDWVLYGSNDDVNYTVLTQATQPMDYNWHSYSFSNTNAYRYYRLNITSSYGSWYGIAEAQLLQ